VLGLDDTQRYAPHAAVSIVLTGLMITIPAIMMLPKASGRHELKAAH